MLKKVKFSFLLSILFLIIFALIGVKALFKDGYFTSHDGWHQVVRIYYFNQSVREGVIPPRYIDGLFYGYGYPLFIFSYHLPWIIAEPFLMMGSSVFSAIKAVYVLTYIISGLTMFIWLKKHFNNFESFVGSFLYLWAPYRFLNIYVRGATGEACIFMFIPLFFLSLDLLKKKITWQNITLGAIAISGLVLSHAIVAFLVLSLALIYIIVSFIYEKKRVIYLLRILTVISVGFCLAAYYLVPSMSLKRFTKFDQRIVATKNEGQFATIKELVYSRWGYGFAVPRLADSMSFQLGIAQWMSISLLVAVILLKFINKKKIIDQPFMIGLSLIFVTAVILIIPQSSLIWKMLIDKVFIVDFSWRLLTVAVFASSALAAYLLSLLGKKGKLIIGFLLIFTALYTNRNHLAVNQYTDIPLSLYLSSEVTTNTYNEYLPEKINSEEIQRLKKGGVIESLQEVDVSDRENKVNSLAFNYNTGEEREFTVHLLYFPGWEAFIDNKKIDIKKDGLGLIKFSVPRGSHKVLINYSGTPLTQFSSFVSLITIIVLFLGFFIKPKKIFKRINF